MSDSNTPGTPNAPNMPNVPNVASASAPRSKSKVPVVLAVVGGCGCVGIGGIAILAAMLFPVFAQAREKARYASCMSNIKQMSLGALQYVQDWDETYPAGKTWMQSINGYVGNEYAYHCPTAAGASGSAATRGQHVAPFGYAYSSDLSEKSLSKVEMPASTPLLYDSSNLEENATDAFSSLPTPARHHSGSKHGNNVGMADGHASLKVQADAP